MLKRGLEHAKIWTVRHGDEHLPGGALDYKALSSKLARIMWHKLESHPIDNLAAERTLALDCYLTKVLGTRMRVLAREAMVKWSMNVRRSGGGLEIDSWSEEQRHRTLRDAMREGRRRIETQHQESARLHKERLPALRASEQQFRVTEAKKAAVVDAFKRMRAEGKEVRHVGAIGLLTAKQVQVQLALRHFLDGLAVKRSGKDDVLRPLLKEQLAAEAAGGEGQLTAEAEIARLKALGFGRKVRAAAPQQPRQANGRSRKLRAPAAAKGSDGSGSDESDESDESDDDDEIDIEELLEKDEDVYEVEKLLDVRQAAGGREFRVKWKGYSAKEATWEVEENILEKGMIKALLARKGKAAPKGAAVAAAASDEPRPTAAAPPPPRPEPTRAQPSRTAAAAAAKRAVAQQDEMSQSDEEEESEEEEARRAPRAVPTGGGKKQKAAPGATKRAPSKGKGTAKKQKTPQAAALQPDSSDEEEGA